MKKLIIYYFFFLLSIFSILSSGVIDSQDGFQYLAVARNIYYEGKPTAPVYEYNKRENVHLSTYLGKDGNTYSPTGLGFSLAYLPAVAITDLVYKIYGVSPPIHFPLENDWLILLTASLTNGFFASLLGITLLLYLMELGLSKKQALFVSFTGLFATNLLAYAKYSFPHMMFVTFLVLSFFLVKKHFHTKSKLLLIFAGASFGITSITYNQTFILAIIPLGLYLLLLSKFRLNPSSIKSLFSKLLIFFVGFLPFLIIYFWFENLRAGGTENLGNPVVLAVRTVIPIIKLPITVFLEGIYGQLFSPGRSIFLYSPILLLIIFFWHRIKKVVLPELLVFIFLSIIYILFYATQYSIGGPDQGIAGLWHGESSWGPRYLTTLIPFGLLVVGFIFTTLKKIEKIFIVLPLLLIGFYIEMLGIIMPYQIKYHDLQHDFFVNSTEFTNHTYSNFIPRYSPIIMMSKKLVKLLQTLPKTLNHGIYNVRFYDGVDFTFPVGGERWRVIEGKGYISFDNLEKDPVKKMAFGVINHPIADSSSSAKLSFVLNDQPLTKSSITLKLRERNIFTPPIDYKLLKDKDNKLIINVEYEDKVIVKDKQILGLIAFSINDIPINLESIDVPYVSALGPAMMGVKYNIYGGEVTDPWRFWELHTQVYERTPDFWWFKYLYYWDIPKMPILLLLAGIILVSIYTGFKLNKL